jgi:hypothetical protein
MQLEKERGGTSHRRERETLREREIGRKRETELVNEKGRETDEERVGNRYECF